MAALGGRKEEGKSSLSSVLLVQVALTSTRLKLHSVIIIICQLLGKKEEVGVGRKYVYSSGWWKSLPHSLSLSLFFPHQSQSGRLAAENDCASSSSFLSVCLSVVGKKWGVGN